MAEVTSRAGRDGMRERGVRGRPAAPSPVESADRLSLQVIETECLATIGRDQGTQDFGLELSSEKADRRHQP